MYLEVETGGVRGRPWSVRGQSAVVRVVRGEKWHPYRGV